ncbi:hypothetical protein QTA56_03340 [Acinetobacter sp. VNH17]|uniref:SMI1/KNR4 family protein n=1 Tax=Acinetobacter thutiue TaxID=2998078 RepID=A0ABT7WKQ6_9GAMM|nr:hypothetical protein [Acinetobacter thutiue]MCY6411172.1 hypothetical protein [Acinetobacter thutiue]MDN0013274.1 hypothetical protein [Acinetobacter thutiue]
MSELWGYDFKKGWIEENNFIDEYIEINHESDLSIVISSLGYRDGFGTYQVNDSVLGNPIQLYELSKDSTLPKYIVEFCPTGSDITYFTARNIPSLIELLNKLSPLVQTAIVCNQIDDEYNNKV